MANNDDDNSDELNDEGPLMEDLKRFGDDDDDSADLSPCPYCGVQIYADGERCPQCGQYIVRDRSCPTRWPLWVVLATIILIIALTWGFWPF